MGDTPDREKKPIENGLSNESEDSGNTSEQEPCLPSDTKGKKDMDTTDTLDSNHLDSEVTKQNKKKHNVNSNGRVSIWISLKTTFANMVTYLREKSGLSNLGLAIAVIVLIMLFICVVCLLIMGLLWPSIPHEMRFPICRRSACLRSSSEILPRMDAEVAPCDDFLGFACGRWLKTHSLPRDRSKWSLRRQLEYKTRDRLRQLIATQPHPTQASSFAWKTKYFYESCMALDNIEMARTIVLISHISALGGWSVLREFQVHSFDFDVTLTRLHSQYGVSLFFNVDVVPDPNSGQDYIIQVLPGSLGLPEKSYYDRDQQSLSVVTYLRFLKDVTQLLGATSSDAAKFSTDMFFFEKRLAEILPEARDLHPLQAAHKITVGELKNLAPSIHLHEILLAKYPESNIDDNTRILLPFPDYLRNLSNLISTCDRTSLNNYMMWRLTESFLPYLNQEYQEAIAVYRKDMFGEEEPLQRWEMCIQTMQRFMGFGLAVLLQNHADNFTEDVKMVEGMFFDTMREVKRTIIKANWLPRELQDHISGKVTSIALEVGFPTGGSLLSDHNLEEMYRQMFVINRDFFQNVKYGITFLQKQQQIRLNKFDEIYRWMDAASSFDLKVRYIAAANKVIVPQALLQEPYFHRDYPPAVLYGGLGVEIGTAAVQAVVPWGVLYADDGTLLDPQHPAVNQTRQAFLYPTTCLTRWWTSEGFASNMVSQHTVYDTLTKLSAVNIAYRALKEDLTYIPHIHQPALEHFEDGHLFFIHYAQTVCSIKSRQQKDLDETLDLKLSDKSILNVILSQSKDFKNLFSCSADNILYTEIPCEDVF